jgi:SAM-dependent methyltransferase
MAKFDKKYYQYAQSDDEWARVYRRRSYLYKAMARAVGRYRPELKDVVEVGCGLGMFSYTLLNRYPSVYLNAGDISEYAVSVTQKNLADFGRAAVIVLNAEDLPYQDETADLIVCFDVIEHLANPEKFFEHAYRILKPGGLLLFTTPNPESFGAKVKGDIERQTGRPFRERMREWFGWRDDTHINIRTIDEWRALSLKTGYVPVRDGTDGCWDVPYFRGVPVVLQKLFFWGGQYILMHLTPSLPWSLGENYIGFWRKPLSHCKP